MNICVLMSLDSTSRNKFLSAFPDDCITFAFDQDIPYDQKQAFDRKFEDALINADVIVGQPPVELIPRAARLKMLQLSMAGTEPYSKPGVLPEGVKLCNATGAFGKAISEHMLASLLMLMKKLHLYRDNMHSGDWRDMGQVRSITDMTVLCVGLGDIGCDFARLCKAMGAHVIGLRRAGTEKPEYVDELYLTDETDTVLPRADVIAMSLPNTPATVNFMSRERFGLIKKGAYLINVGRGNAIDQEALYDALNDGTLDGASIDVASPEPLPQSSPLWKCERLLITPHVSGFYHLRKTYDNIVDIAISNIRSFKGGDRLLTEVDFATGYKKTER